MIMQSPWRLYTDREYLPPAFPHYPILYPFWGKAPARGDDLIDVDRFTSYSVVAPGIFKLTSLREADAAVVPFAWNELLDVGKNFPESEAARLSEQAKAVAETLAEKAAARGVPLLVFLVCDDHRPEVPLQNSVVFRPSLERSARRNNEFPLPGFRSDFVASYCGGEIPVRPKRSRPTVGYCGYDNTRRGTFKARIQHELGRRPEVSRAFHKAGVTLIEHEGSRLRSQALYRLAHSSRVSTKFIIRNAFWNGTITRHSIDTTSALAARFEYVGNMLGSDYILCARGSGNYSFRFYEALSCGRIPVYIDSGGVLPFEDVVDYREFCVWVGEGEIHRIDEIVAEFHDRLSSRQFQEVQHHCRDVWRRWLSPEGFFGNMPQLVSRHTHSHPGSSSLRIVDSLGASFGAG